MSSRMNVNAGILDGINTSMSILDAVDAREERRNRTNRQQALDARAAEEYTYNKKRRGVLDERQDDEYEYQVDRRDITDERIDADYEYSRERRGVLDSQNDATHASNMESAAVNRKATKQRLEHEKDMMPWELSLAKAQSSNAYSSVELNKIKVRQAQQAEKAELVKNGVNELMVHLGNGDIEKAQIAAKNMEQFGFDVESIQQGGVSEKGRNIARSLINGELDLDSPDAAWLAQQVLTPALVASGRDPQSIKVKGLKVVEDDGPPRFNVLLENASGDTVPATLNASSDDHDRLTEIPIEHLMTATTSWLSTANAIESATEADLQQSAEALQAQYGVLPGAQKEQSPAMMNAQLKRDEYERELEMESSENFVNSYEEGSPMQAVARLLVDQQGYDPETTPQQINEIQALADEEETDVQMATQLYLRRQETAQLLESESAKIAEENGIEGADAMKIAKGIQTGKYTLAEANKRIAKLKAAADKAAEKAAEKAKRQAARVEKKKIRAEELNNEILQKKQSGNAVNSMRDGPGVL